MDISLIKFTPLFAGLTESELDTLSNHSDPDSLSEGEQLFRTGEKSDSLYILHKGFVRLATQSGQSLATLGPGSVLGEASLFGNAPLDVDASAVSDIEFWRLSDQKLRTIILEQPSIGLQLGKNFGQMIAQMQDYLVAQLKKTQELGNVPRHTLEAFASQLQPVEVNAGETLYRSSEGALGLSLLESGSIRLEPEAGAEESPKIVQSGAILGTSALLTDKPYGHNAVAQENSVVWQISAQSFHMLNSQHPGLRRSLSRSVRAPLTKADQNVASMRLSEMPLFAQLPSTTVQNIAQRMLLQHASAGERVYRVGEAGDALYLIESGEIELTAENASGVIEELARIQGEGFFGKMSLFTGQIRTEDATATRNTNLWVLYKSDLDTLAAQYPEIGSALSQGLATRLAEEQSGDEQRFRNYEIFQNLANSDLQQITQFLQPTRFRQGEIIYRASSPAETLYLIEQGEIQVQTYNGGSWILGAGESFGERALLTNQPHSATVSAVTDVDLWALNKYDFDSLLTQHPSLAINISRMLSQQLADTNAYTDPVQQPTPPQQAFRRPAPSLDPEPIDGSMGLTSRRRQAVAAEASAAGMERERVDLFQWFSGLSSFAKLRLAIIILLLIWLLGIAAPVALLRLVQGSRVASSASLPISASSSIAAVYRMGSYEVASRDEGIALAIAMADRAVSATATYTPPPTNTPIPTNTPLPTNTPRPTVRAFIQAVADLAPELEIEVDEDLIQAAALPVRIWDQRLSQLGVRVEEAPVASGQQYWRLIEANWWDEKEAGGKHHIYVEVLDENGSRIVGHPVKITWGDGEHIENTQDKPFPEYAFNYQMYAAGNAYNVEILGLPSDRLIGAGMGDLERRAWGIHTSTLLTFRKTTAP